jgi:lipopolysaccharide transport system ATP-binding protein
MSDVAIRVEGLSKSYRLGGKQEPYKTLRESLIGAAKAPLRMLRGRRAGKPETLWALRDVSFEVRTGEVVGIIGRNGAGKSTLLKILARITDPSEGRAEIHGRIGSMLEVGTGFHPELSGRENIFLNGVILGMRRAEIARKFDEIVAFAEIEKFVDTPVKHYSSGMYVRLAFAVGAHLDPEILLVDEVLAVGDASFQKRCLGKMSEVAGQGRTVFFVTHDMAAIAALCTRAMVFEQGRLVHSDTAQAAIAEYLRRVSNTASIPLAERRDRQGNGLLRFTGLAIRNAHGEASDTISAGEDVTIELTYDVAAAGVRQVVFQLAFFDSLGRTLFVCFTRTVNQSFDAVPSGSRILCRIPRLPLAPGAYGISVWCKEGSHNLADRIDAAARFTVTSGDFFGTGKVPPQDGGPFMVRHDWELVDAAGVAATERALP